MDDTSSRLRLATYDLNIVLVRRKRVLMRVRVRVIVCLIGGEKRKGNGRCEAPNFTRYLATLQTVSVTTCGGGGGGRITAAKRPFARRTTAALPNMRELNRLCADYAFQTSVSRIVVIRR